MSVYIYCGKERRRANYLGRSDPNLEHGTVRVCCIYGFRNGLKTTLHSSSSVPGQGAAFLPMFKPLRGPLLTYTRTVPGSRLGTATSGT